MDKYFHTNVTNVIEDNTMFYEGSFMADLQSAVNIIATLLLPHFQSIMNLSFPDLMSGIVDAVRKQKPIEYHGELMDLDAPIIKEIKHYSKMIVGAYGKKFNMKQKEDVPDTDLFTYMTTNDISSMFEIQVGDEAYIEFLLEHSTLSVNDLLYCCFEGDTLKTESGIEFHSPPLFILRDVASKSIVVLVRGTQNLNDIVVDIYGNNMKWEEGAVHEGMGTIAEWIATDNLIHTTIEDALNSNKEYTLKVVGHSLGAGIAALTTIYWKNHRTFWQYEFKRGKEFLRCFAFAPPPVLSKEIKEKGVGYVYSIVNEDDIVPRLNVKCIYGALHDIEECVDNHKKEEVLDDIEEVKEARKAFQQQELRQSLRHVIHQKDSTDNNENNMNSIRIKTKASFENNFSHMIEKMKKIENWFKSDKDKEDEEPIYGDFVLPGSIYLLHPYIANGESYMLYENTKSALTTSWRAALAFLTTNKVTKAPGIMYFSDESQFPQVLRLSPFLTVHHNYRVYEESISKITDSADSESS